MKTLLRILAGLYPTAWRKRYGAEFEALIEDARPGLGGAVDILKGALAMQVTSWTPSRVLALSAIAGVLVAIGIAYAMPPRWSSTAVIQIASAGPLDKKAVEQVNTAANKVLSRSELTKMMRANDIYGNNLKTSVVEDVLEIFKRDIRVAPLPSANGAAFEVRFIYGDPRVAQQVAQALAKRFVEAGPETFRLVEVANLPQQPINTTFSAKIATAGLGGGLLLGAPLAGFLYWRRRKQP